VLLLRGLSGEGHQLHHPVASPNQLLGREGVQALHVDGPREGNGWKPVEIHAPMLSEILKEIKERLGSENRAP